MAVGAEAQAGGEGEQPKPDYPVKGRCAMIATMAFDEALLAKPDARPFEMRGLEMKGWLRVDAPSASKK